MVSLVDLPAGVGHIASRVRWEVLSSDLDPIGSVSPEDQRVIIAASTTSNIGRTCRGFTLRANDARHLNPFRDRLRPVWEYEDGSRYNLGVFMLGSPERRVGSAHVLVDATLVDQSFVLDQPMTRSYGLWRNGLVCDAIVELVEEAGITSHRIDFTDQKVGGPLNWPIGTSRLRILRALCEQAGLLPPYFDSDGVLVVRPAADPVEGQVLRYDSGSTSRIYEGTVAERDNVLDAPNVYVVVGLSPSRTEIVGRAEIDPRLPHSIQNRDGLEVAKVTRIQGLSSTQQAQRIAQTQAAADPFQLAAVDFESAPDPRHSLFDLVEYDGSVWNEEAWTMELRPGGRHSHRLTKQVLGLENGVD
jgi:hypothetical protein